MRPEPCLLKRHYAIVVLDETSVLLRSESRERVLSGRLYTRLLPLLDGTSSRSDIARSLRGEFASEEVFRALNRLRRLDLLATADSLEHPAAAFIDGIGGDAGRLARAQARWPIAVHAFGTAGRHRAVLNRALARAGWRTDDDEAGVALIVTDRYSRAELERFVRALVERGAPFLLFKPIGRVLWLGPVVATGAAHDEEAVAATDAFDPELFFRRLRRNEPTTGNAPPPPPLETPASVRAAVAMAVTSLDRFFADPLRSELADSLVTIDLATMASTRHPLPRWYPDCVPMDGHGPWTLSPCHRLPGQRSGSRSCTPEETIARLERHLSPLTGIVRRIERIVETPGYVFGASHLNPFPERADDAVALRESTLHIGFAHGKGSSSEQSRASCLSEAIERYSACYQGTETVRLASARTLGSTCHPPSRLVHFSPRQFAERERLNAELAASHYVPRRYPSEAEIHWTASWSLTEAATRWLPTSYCYLHYPELDYCLATSNGCAAGNTREEAIVQGFLELVERDAVAIWWYNRLARPAVDLGRVRGTLAQDAARYHASIGRVLHLLDVTADLGIPTVVAVSARQDGGGIHLRSGAHFDPTIAVTRALTELDQAAPFERVDDGGLVERSFGTASWLRHATLADHPHLLPDAAARPVAVVATPRSDDILDDVRLMTDCCRRAGLDVSLLDLTRAETGFPVVRVVVPGLRHWSAQLGPGRLYDVPLALGWRSEPIREDDMNPVPWPC